MTKVPEGLPSGSRVAAQVVLQQIRLSEARLEVFPEPLASTVDVELDINLRTGWDLTGDILNVGVGLWVRLLPTGSSDAEKGLEADEVLAVLEIVAEHTVEYRLPEDLEPSEDELRGFVEQSAVLTAWPYAREVIQSLAAKASVPQLTLPMHKVPLPLPGASKESTVKKASPTKTPAKKRAVKKSSSAKRAVPRKDGAKSTRSE